MTTASEMRKLMESMDSIQSVIENVHGDTEDDVVNFLNAESNYGGRKGLSKENLYFRPGGMKGNWLVADKRGRFAAVVYLDRHEFEDIEDVKSAMKLVKEFAGHRFQ